MPATPLSRFWRNSARELPLGAVKPTPVMTMREGFIRWERKSLANPAPKAIQASLHERARRRRRRLHRQPLRPPAHRRRAPSVVLDNLVYGHRAAVAPGVSF